MVYHIYCLKVSNLLYLYITKSHIRDLFRQDILLIQLFIIYVKSQINFGIDV